MLIKRILGGAVLVLAGMAIESLLLTQPACDKHGYFFNFLGEKYVCYPDKSETLK